VLLSYPCIEAITVQRLAHGLYLLEVPFIPRMMTEVAHSNTGIDINPGATIGESFFIDHGTGVVIGETATIGEKVTLYHGVTLGAFNPLMKDDHARLRRGQTNKRHPDLEDHVTVYPNATILGGGTRVGHHSIIGGNVWLTHSVEPYSKVVVEDPELLIRNIEPLGKAAQGVIPEAPVNRQGSAGPRTHQRLDASKGRPAQQRAHEQSPQQGGSDDARLWEVIAAGP
jgi:serine O-acetyltransferase